jgi:hypothetical protein
LPLFIDLPSREGRGRSTNVFYQRLNEGSVCKSGARHAKTSMPQAAAPVIALRRHVLFTPYGLHIIQPVRKIVIQFSGINEISVASTNRGCQDSPRKANLSKDGDAKPPVYGTQF